MAKPVSLVCYTVSDSESSEEEEEEMDDVNSAVMAVNYVIERILREVTHGLRDFGDLYIKQEPQDCEEEWEAVGQDYRDGTAVKVEDDDDSSSSSSEDESLPDVTVVKTEVEMEAETEGMVLCETDFLTFKIIVADPRSLNPDPGFFGEFGSGFNVDVMTMQ
jgi:hypothetical protein